MYERFGGTLAYLDKADGWDYSVEAARAGAAHSYVYHDHPAAEPTNRRCRTGSEGRWPGPVGTAVVRRNDVSPNLIRPGASANGPARAGHGHQSDVWILDNHKPAKGKVKV